MSSKKKNRKNEKQLEKDLEKNEETSEEIEEDNSNDNDSKEDEKEESEEESEEIEEDDSDDNDSDEDEKEESEEESKEEDSDKDSKDNSEDNLEKEEISKDKNNKKVKDKKDNQKEDSDDEPDYFWVKVLIVTIIIVWAALIAGSWAGNYFLKSEFFKKYNSQVVDDNKPKVWKTVVEVDKSGVVSKSAVLADNTDDLQIDDFRNTNEPIPGIDDQSLKSLKDIEPLQEPSDDSSAVEIQITSEDTMENANKIAKDLKAKGYNNPIVEPFVENGVNRYRVKISESSTENANKKIEELKALNYKASIIGK